MKNAMLRMMFLSALFCLSVTLYAGSSDVSVRVSCAIKPTGGKMVLDDNTGQWVVPKDTKVSGFISLEINLDVDKDVYEYKITGSKNEGGTTIYQVKNGESFYLDSSTFATEGQETPKPVVKNLKQIPYKNLQQAIDAYRKEKTDKLAWIIWKLKNRR